MADRVGQQLGNYRLLRLLGSGGFADVYLGSHLYLETQAAVKVLRTRLAEREHELFRREARTIAHLRHPHIVRVLEFGIEGETPFLIMDYAPHGSLRQRHPKGTPLPLPLVVSYVKQVALALHSAHEQHIIHRDLKPENLLLSEQDEVMLSDFGIAVVAHSTSSMKTEAYSGTPYYSAPEQIAGKPRTASDQYALGILVYEWLTGTCPFLGDIAQVIYQQMSATPPPMREKLPMLPHEVEQVVMRSLAKDPAQRFANMVAFATALEEASQTAASEFDPTPSNTEAEPSHVPPQGGRHAAQTDAGDVPPKQETSPSAPISPIESVLPPAPELPPPLLALPGGQSRHEAAKDPSERLAARINLVPVGFAALVLPLLGWSFSNAQLLPFNGVFFGLLFAIGGLAQLVTGVRALRGRDTFIGTALCSYGACWLARALIVFPSFGIIASGGAGSGIGLAYFLLGWTILTGLLFLVSLKGNTLLMTFFALLFLHFTFLTLSQFMGSSSLTIFGGWLGILTFVVAVPLIWYAATHPAQAMMPLSLTVQPVPLSLGAFAFTFFLLSVGNAGLATTGGIIAGPALFYGGLVSILAGLQTLRVGKTFVGALFRTYGVFWATVGLLLLSVLPILAGMSAQSANLTTTVLFLAWTIVTSAWLFASLKSSKIFMVLSLAAVLAFLALTIGAFTYEYSWTNLGGWLGLLASGIAWYGMLAILLREAKGLFSLPGGARE